MKNLTDEELETLTATTRDLGIASRYGPDHLFQSMLLRALEELQASRPELLELRKDRQRIESYVAPPSLVFQVYMGVPGEIQVIGAHDESDPVEYFAAKPDGWRDAVDLSIELNAEAAERIAGGEEESMAAEMVALAWWERNVEPFIEPRS